MLEFNKSTFLWDLREPIEIEKRTIPNEIILLSDFVKFNSSFTGTATELAEKLKEFNQTDCKPAILKKKIIKHMSYLNENNITYSENRTFERREFSLCYDGNDSMTVENSLIKLPSFPSQPSAECNSEVIAHCLPLCEPLADKVG